MFYSLTGNVIFSDSASIAIECSGIGFRCFTSMNTLKKCGLTGTSLTLYTYLAVREDAVELYGFYDVRELEFFKLLISVSGVGPKAAIAILSEHTPESLTVCIASGDVKSITRAQGVGPKIAQRVVLELKDKIARNMPQGLSGEDINGIASVGASANTSEAVSALMVLGYSQAQASFAVAKLDPVLSVEALIKEALKLLAGGLNK